MAVISLRAYDGPSRSFGAVPNSNATDPNSNGMGGLSLANGTTIEQGNVYVINPTGNAINAVNSASVNQSTWASGIFMGSELGAPTLTGVSTTTYASLSAFITDFVNDATNAVATIGSICYFLNSTTVTSAQATNQPIAGRVLGFTTDSRVIVDMLDRG